MDLFFTIFPFSVIAFILILERHKKVFVNFFNQRDRINLYLGGMSFIVKYVFSGYILLTYVNFLAPYQILSISNLDLPKWVTFIIGLLLLDLMEYWSHRIHHLINPLWKLHRIHHCDKKVDVLTTFLHHPLEVLTAVLFIVATLVIFDIPVIVIVTYGLIVGFFGALSHTEILFNDRLNNAASKIFVTPNFHKIHHSLDYDESNSNFGLVLSVWDRLFFTYKKKSRKDLIGQELGIDDQQSPEKEALICYILNPLKGSKK